MEKGAYAFEDLKFNEHISPSPSLPSPFQIVEKEVEDKRIFRSI